jgi:hypothetical protein
VCGGGFVFLGGRGNPSCVVVQSVLGSLSTGAGGGQMGQVGTIALVVVLRTLLQDRIASLNGRSVEHVLKQVRASSVGAPWTTSRVQLFEGKGETLESNRNSDGNAMRSPWTATRALCRNGRKGIFGTLTPRGFVRLGLRRTRPPLCG